MIVTFPNMSSPLAVLLEEIGVKDSLGDEALIETVPLEDDKKDDKKAAAKAKAVKILNKQTCPKCGHVFPLAHMLTRHLISHRKTVTKCPYPFCYRVFKFPASVLIHIRNKHQ